MYSSTRDALQVLRQGHMLWHVPCHFDDVEFIFNSRWGGELLAIEEFNQQSPMVKIDRWHGVRNGKAFPERGYFDRMYVAHDLASVSAVARRDTAQLKLR